MPIMRREFFKELELHMEYDNTIVVITADLGYGILDGIKNKYNGIRYFNVQACEQQMILAAIGMNLSGKKVFCYSITPFLLYRPYEMLKLYIEKEEIDITLVGSGRGMDYLADGITHYDSGCDLKIKQFYPKNILEMKNNLNEILKTNTPSYINLIR